MEGDIFVGCSHGGVGYGDVLERDPLLVMRDLKSEVISGWVAENVYCVVYDLESFIFDVKATELRRAKVREKRLQKGLRYDEFIKKWAVQKPDPAILAYYGPWPTEDHPQEADQPEEKSSNALNFYV